MPTLTLREIIYPILILFPNKERRQPLREASGYHYLANQIGARRLYRIPDGSTYTIPSKRTSDSRRWHLGRLRVGVKGAIATFITRMHQGWAYELLPCTFLLVINGN